MYQPPDGQWNPQPPLPPSHPYGSPPLPPLPPSDPRLVSPQPAPRKRRRLPWIIGIITAVLLFSCIICSIVGSHTSSTTTATTQQSTTQPSTRSTAATQAPTHEPQSTQPAAKPQPMQSTPSAAPSNSVILGQPISHFIARYGPASMNMGVYIFQHYALTVSADAQNHNLVFDIIDSNTGSNGWNSIGEAKAACSVFLPADATYKRQLTLQSQNAIEQVYLVPSLAHLFSAGDFKDENGNPAPPGTVGVVYAHDTSTSSHITSCDVQIGVLGVREEGRVTNQPKDCRYRRCPLTVSR